jgi:hypothetical protein
MSKVKQAIWDQIEEGKEIEEVKWPEQSKGEEKQEIQTT